jgi:acetyl esterase/lipase
MRKLMNTYRRRCPEVLFGVNSMALVLGITYFFVGKMSTFWNTYGILMLVTFSSNSLFAAAEERLRGLSKLYLALSAVWMFAVMLINTAVSLNPVNEASQSTVSVLMTLSLFFLGGLLAEKHILNQDKEDDSDYVKNRKKMIIRNIVIIILSAVLYGGLFLAVNLLRVQKLGLLEVILPEYALFYSVIFLSIGLLILKLLDRGKYWLYSSFVIAVTVIMTAIFLLPFASIPKLLKNSETAYEQAFTDFYKKNPVFQTTSFRQLPFSLPEYFYGSPSGNYQVKENVLYNEDTEGADKGLKLYFDVYMPETDGKELPGGNSVLIRIHGGAWTSGDKGAQNFAQMNKYFAAQGYVVFDIQYGLNDLRRWMDILPVSNTAKGDFTIDDMIRHIGSFTDYLTEHAAEYHANLDSVFLSGGSAGGQLALASGLAMAGGIYQDIFNPRLIIKGLIPFYPANGLSLELNITGTEALVELGLLVDKNSPPCLIFQGSHDGLVSSDIAKQFKDQYLKAGNNQCAVIEMPYGSHACDCYFPGYYNQVFLYYMERFMYQYK